MRTVPTESDQKDVERLNAEPWQLDLLALNPEYPFWGPHEENMVAKDGSWNAPIFVDSWANFEIVVNDLNEVVNFYFAVERESSKCGSCDGTGYGPKAKKIADDYYDFANTGRRWVNRITLDEAQALVDAARLCRWDGQKWAHPAVVDDAFVALVNAANDRAGGFGDMSHDAINRGILIEARCKRLGIELLCPACEGRGYVFTAPRAHVQLVLWLLHPRKGASRGVEIERIERSDLPAVFAFLKGAADRNAERFAEVCRLHDEESKRS